jgi:hypothetical protein
MFPLLLELGGFKNKTGFGIIQHYYSNIFLTAQSPVTAPDGVPPHNLMMMIDIHPQGMWPLAITHHT